MNIERIEGVEVVLAWFHINCVRPYILWHPINLILNFWNVEPSNLVLLKTYIIDLDSFIIAFTGKNGRPLEMENRDNMTLIIDK